MKLRLLDLVVCPLCGAGFTCRADHTVTQEYSAAWMERLRHRYDTLSPRWERKSWREYFDSYREAVVSGKLSCTECGEIYPIIGGIPRILSEELRTVGGAMGRGNPDADIRMGSLMDQAAELGIQDDLFNRVQMANQSNYGYEWKVFSHEYEQWGTLHARYSGIKDTTFFHNKIGFDAGCGMGRYSLVPVQHGAEVVGIDLSNAIEAAYAKSLGIPTFHAVQGDIFHLPFREGYFDFAQSLGVIHITPNPKLALSCIHHFVAPGGTISFYVYSTFEDEVPIKYHLLKLINQFRRLTIRLPSNKLYHLLYAVVPFVVLCAYLPSRLLWHMGLRKWSMMFPYSYEQYRDRRLRDIHMNLFDRFGNPVERRYNRKHMVDWMAREGFEEYRLLHRDGWVVVAKVANHDMQRVEKQ